MKMRVAFLVFSMMPADILFAQAVHSSLEVHPYLSNGKLSASRFWTPSTIALIAVDGAAKAADSYATRKNIDGGGLEFNPLARPFVHTTGVQVSAMAAMLGAEVATAYLLHRWRHDNLARGVLASGAIINGLGAASSIKHRVADW
jgi:hypothetical protein